MNTKREKLNFNWAQFDMLILCIELAAENNNVVDLIPDFKEDILTVKSKLQTIQSFIADQKQNTTGTTEQKLNLKRSLVEKLLPVSNQVAANAYRKGDEELYAAISKSKSAYMRMRPTMLISQADNVISTVTPLLPNLIGTSVTQQSLDAIAEAREQFAPYATKSRSKVVSKHGDLKTMVTLLKQCMNITRRSLDKQVVAFLSLNQPSFYDQWVRSRKLTPYGTLTTRASVDVYMGDANSPVSGAFVSVDNTPLKGTTNDKGHTTISRVPFKLEQYITVSAPGFENPVTAGPFSFKKGKATHIVINMNEFTIPSVAAIRNNDVPAEHEQK